MQASEKIRDSGGLSLKVSYIVRNFSSTLMRDNRIAEAGDLNVKGTLFTYDWTISRSMLGAENGKSHPRWNMGNI